MARDKKSSVSAPILPPDPRNGGNILTWAVKLFAWLKKQRVLAGEGIDELPGPNGRIFKVTRDEPFYAAVTWDTSGYDFTEQVYRTTGWAAKTDGRTGDKKALEVDGKEHVPAGAIVLLRKATDENGAVWYVFNYEKVYFWATVEWDVAGAEWDFTEKQRSATAFTTLTSPRTGTAIEANAITGKSGDSFIAQVWVDDVSGTGTVYTFFYPLGFCVPTIA